MPGLHGAAGNPNDATAAGPVWAGQLWRQRCLAGASCPGAPASWKVGYRLIAVGGRRERNPWIAAARLPVGDLQALGRGQENARVVLESLACQRGHRARRALGRLSSGAHIRRELGAGPLR